jgi:hypothetical protein
MNSTVSLAPHLQRALDAMSKDMGVDQQALVNQAVFAWLRINGYASSSAAAVAPAIPAVAPVAVIPPEPVRAMPTPVPVAVPVALPPPPAPVAVVAPVAVEVAAPVAVVAPVAVAVDVGPALLRMKEIDADLEKLTKPWPAWAPVQAEEEEEEQEEQEEAQDEPEQDEAPEEEPAPEAPEEEPEAPVASAPDEEPQPPEQDEVGLEGNTGENPYGEDDAGESTIVLRSVPIALYLQREGEDEIRVASDRFVIGRGPHCDLVIDSPRVSREHVAITRKGVLFYLEDLNSSNGTWLGEERLTRRELESGDLINLGNEPVTFVIRGE